MLFCWEQFLLIYMVFASAYGGEIFNIPKQKESFEFKPDSAWLNVIPYSRIFAVQGFFVIVFVYLKERTGTEGRSKQKRSNGVYLYSGLIMSVNAFTYGFCDSKDLYLRLDKPMVYIWDLGFVLMSFILILI